MPTPVEQAVQALRQQEQEALAKETARQVVRLQDIAAQLNDILAELTPAITVALASPPSAQALQELRALAARHGRFLPSSSAMRASEISASSIASGTIDAARVHPNSVTKSLIAG